MLSESTLSFVQVQLRASDAKSCEFIELMRWNESFSCTNLQTRRVTNHSFPNTRMWLVTLLYDIGDFLNVNGQQPIFRNHFLCIHYHLCKILTQIIGCKFFSWFINNIIIIIIIIIIKTGSTDPSGKNKIVYKLLSHHNKHLPVGWILNTFFMIVLSRYCCSNHQHIRWITYSTYSKNITQHFSFTIILAITD